MEKEVKKKRMVIPLFKKGVAVMHAGFMTYLLIVILVFVAIYFASPQVAAKITAAVTSLFHSFKG